MVTKNTLHSLSTGTEIVEMKVDQVKSESVVLLHAPSNVIFLIPECHSLERLPPPYEIHQTRLTQPRACENQVVQNETSIKCDNDLDYHFLDPTRFTAVQSQIFIFIPVIMFIIVLFFLIFRV